jgi:phosphoenolpyruvate synthase/pyruvate phosphate dikinase
MSVIVWLDAAGAPSRRLGGKGASLVELHRGGFPVPPGFVVAAEAYERFADANGLRAAMDTVLATPNLRLPKVAREAAAPLEERLASATLPDDLAAAIAGAYAELRRRGTEVVAARSSALSEDGANASSAGLYETYLNLRDLHAVQEAVRRCYASLWSMRAIQYRAFKGLNSPDEAMAVVVMALVPAEAAGVAFTANPITGNRGQIVVNASWGLGEAVVSGRVTPDSYILDKHSLHVLERDVQAKEVEIVADPAGASGTIQRAVDGPRTAAPALTDDELHRLGDLCRAIEGCYGRPMDVEWATVSGMLYVLQARPITALA